MTNTEQAAIATGTTVRIAGTYPRVYGTVTTEVDGMGTAYVQLDGDWGTHRYGVELLIPANRPTERRVWLPNL